MERPDLAGLSEGFDLVYEQVTNRVIRELSEDWPRNDGWLVDSAAAEKVRFLPPPVQTDEDGDADYHRAVVFITDETEKGTDRSGQRVRRSRWYDGCSAHLRIVGRQ